MLFFEHHLDLGSQALDVLYVSVF